jgi:integrase
MKGHIARKTGKGGRYRYYPVVELPPEPGSDKRRRKWHRGYDRKKDAEAALAKLITSIHDHTYIEPNKTTVAEWVAQWLPSIQADVKQSTWASYRTTLEQHVVPRIGGLQLQRLGRTDLGTMYANLLADGRVRGPGGLSPTTVRYVHVVLKRCLRDAVRGGLVTRNPAELVDAPRGAGRSVEFHVWDAGQARQFLRHVREDRLAGLWSLAVGTGMRRGELLGLRWSDVDLEAGRVSVVRSLVVRGHYRDVHIETPKTGAGTRTVGLDQDLVATLKRHRAVQAEERLAWGPAWADSGLVFGRENGEPLHPSGVSKRFLKLSREAKVPRLRFHDIRHTHATLLLLGGVPAKVVSERLGHANIAITLDTYSHVLPRMDEAAAATFGAMLRDVAGEH